MLRTGTGRSTWRDTRTTRAGPLRARRSRHEAVFCMERTVCCRRPEVVPEYPIVGAMSSATPFRIGTARER
eukprot:1489733-Pleurochrysis_carterae.AAC.1